MANGPTVFRLSDLDIGEVSLVPKGANKKRFFLAKELQMDEDELVELLTNGTLEKEAEIDTEMEKAGLSAKGQRAVKGALRMLSGVKNEIPGDLLRTLAGLAGYGYPPPSKKGNSGGKSNMSKEGLDLSAVPEELRPTIQALADTASSMQKTIEGEKAQRVTREFTEKAKAFDALGIPAETLGPILKATHDSSPEQAEALMKLFGTTCEAIKKAKDAATPASTTEAGAAGDGKTPTTKSDDGKPGEGGDGKPGATAANPQVDELRKSIGALTDGLKKVNEAVEKMAKDPVAPRSDGEGGNAGTSTETNKGEENIWAGVL